MRVEAQTAGPSAQLLNISTRMRVQGGENVLIAGFIVTGSQPKKVIIRGIGPSLSGAIQGALADPTLDLFQGGTLLQSNDNWQDSQPAEIEGTSIPPTHPAESAIVITLAPGAYTAVLRGKGDGAGIGVVEAYDLAQSSDAKLANISTRGFVDAGDNVMIAGIIVGGPGGNAGSSVIVRGLGPSLVSAGIANALQDPTLDLRDANGTSVTGNDDWQQFDQPKIEKTGIAPANPAEATVMASLWPGNYTAIMRGKNNTTGVGLVEVYNLGSAVPSPPTVTISAEKKFVQLSENLLFNWKTQGDLSGLQLFIRARGPGAPYAPAGQIYLNSGTLPANGPAYYLAPDGSWTQTETAYGSPGPSGNASVSFPNSALGEWRVQAILRDVASGEIVGMAENSWLRSSDKPAVLLRLNRPVANTTDKVSAELLVAAANYPDEVTVDAWMLSPDGIERSLPTLDPGLTHFYEGPAANLELSLFDRYFDDFGPGTYAVRVRLSRRTDNELLALAEGTFQVCDGPRVVTGIVTASNGQPLGGSATYAVVNALDIDELFIATAEIAADGTYSLALKPGRYLLSANVLDSAGHHPAEKQGVIVVDCGSSPIQVNLAATAPSGAGQNVFAATGNATAERVLTPNASPSPSPPAENASDGLPKPEVVISYNNEGLDPVAAKNFLRDFATWIRQAAGPDVKFITVFEIQQVFNSAAVELLYGQDENSASNFDLDRLVRLIGKEFVLSVEFEQIDNCNICRSVRSRVVDTKNEAAVRAKEQNNPGGQITGGMVLELASQTGIDLFQVLRDAQDHPIRPKLNLLLSPDRIPTGGQVAPHGTLTEGDLSLTPQANEPDTPVEALTLKWVGFGIGGGGPVPLQTNAQGAFSMTFGAGSVTGSGQVLVEFARRGRVIAEARHSFHVVDPGGDLQLTSARAELKPGQPEPVCVSLKHGGAPVPGKTVSLAATGGTLSTGSVTTDANGQGCVTFTASPGSLLGISTGAGRSATVPAAQLATLANITATFDGTLPGSNNPVNLTAGLPFAVDPGVINLTNAATTSLDSGGFTEITTDVTIAGAQLAGIPVSYSLSGNGTLSSANAGTDDNGRARTLYLAPAEGTGSAVVTATVVVNGQPYPKSVTINYQPPGTPNRRLKVTVLNPKIRIYSDGVGDSTVSQPSGPPPVSMNLAHGLGNLNVEMKQVDANTFTVDATGEARTVLENDQLKRCVVECPFDLKIEVVPTTNTDNASSVDGAVVGGGTLKVELSRSWGSPGFGAGDIRVDAPNPLGSTFYYPIDPSTETTASTTMYIGNTLETHAFLNLRGLFHFDGYVPVTCSGRVLTITFTPDP